jgi:hypothetical protein
MSEQDLSDALARLIKPYVEGERQGRTDHEVNAYLVLALVSLCLAKPSPMHAAMLDSLAAAVGVMTGSMPVAVVIAPPGVNVTSVRLIPEDTPSRPTGQMNTPTKES